MATSIPGPRDDDPEEVSDKLSIAAAMWARGETADAISWLRRAAASAADVEADDRALELAKAAADLQQAAAAAPPAKAPMNSTAPTGTRPATVAPPSKPASPPKPPPSRGPTAGPSVGSRPPAAGPRPAPRATGQPAAGSARLAPLPPLRPLGAASQQMRASQRPTADPEAAHEETGARAQPVVDEAASHGILAASAPLAEDGIDHDQTSVMPVAQAEALAKSEPPNPPPDATPAAAATRPSEIATDDDVRETMRRDADAEAALPAEPPHEPPPSASMHAAAMPVDEAAPHVEPQLAVGLRIRLYATEGGAWAVPDSPGAQGGVAAIVVPAHLADDLRAVFAREP